jgi:hypothetical protein
LRDSISCFLRANSTYAANRSCINNDPKDKNYNIKVAAKYLNDSKVELYKKFPLRNKISLSTFCKYMKLCNEFKQRTRFSDLCDHCEKAKSLKVKFLFRYNFIQIKKINFYFYTFLYKKLELSKKLSGDFDYPQQDVYSTTAMNSHLKVFEQEYYDKIIRGNRTQENGSNLRVVQELMAQIRQYSTLMFHKNTAKAQRAAYNANRQNIENLRNKIMIDVDFKMKVVVGFSPRQINSEYYNQKLNKRSILGIID